MTLVNLIPGCVIVRAIWAVTIVIVLIHCCVSQARQEARGAAMGSFFDQLEAKYAKPEKKTKARKQKAI